MTGREGEGPSFPRGSRSQLVILICAGFMIALGIVLGVFGISEGWLVLAVGAVLVVVSSFLRIVQLGRRD